MSARRPEMKGILESAPTKTKPKQRTAQFRSAAAALLALLIFFGFISCVLSMGTVIESYPGLRKVQPLLFPVLALIMILFEIPLIFYLSFQDEFGDINPLIPTHYAFLVKRAVVAIKDNDFQVSAKDI